MPLFVRAEAPAPEISGFCNRFWWRLAGAGLIASILAVYPSVYYVTHPDLRYRHPIDPEILLLAVYAVTSLKETAGKATAAEWLQAETEPELAETAAAPGKGGLGPV